MSHHQTPARTSPAPLCCVLASALVVMAGCTTTTTTTKAPAGNSVRRGSPAAWTSKTPPPKPTPDQLAAAAAEETVRQVTATEQAFAKSMADRNFEAFTAFLSPEAVFFSGNQIHRGGDAVAEAWQPYFVGPKAPFSWRPDHVEVLASGKLALSTGPVYQGPNVVGRFNSIWRLEGPNQWRIVFDKGEAVCNVLPDAP